MDSYGLASVGMYGSVFDRNFLSFLSSSWFRSLPGHSLVGVQLEVRKELCHGRTRQGPGPGP